MKPQKQQQKNNKKTTAKTDKTKP